MSHDAGMGHTLTAEQVALPPRSGWARLPAAGAVLAVAGLGGAALLAGSDPQRFFRSYLVAYLFWLSIALGGLFFVLVQHATRAGWSVVVRRVAEQIMGTLPLFALLFVPLVFGLHQLYHWSQPAAPHAELDHLLHHKRPYLNETFFFARAIVYLGVWSLLAWWFRRQSLRQDASGDHGLTRRAQAVSGPSLAVFAVTVTFAAFDWAMSLDPHWYSTIFGVYFFAGCAVGFHALTAVLAVALRRSVGLARIISVEHLHDLGKLLFAFVCFWAYIAFSQFLLYWYANIPEETVWFLRRFHGGWLRLSVFLAVGHFIVPFFFLLPRTIKRSGGALVVAALWVLVMHYADLYWLVMPGLGTKVMATAGPTLTLLDVTTFVGIGGAFFAVLGTLVRRAAIVPLRDPRLPESLSFENT